MVGTAGVVFAGVDAWFGFAGPLDTGLVGTAGVDALFGPGEAFFCGVVFLAGAPGGGAPAGGRTGGVLREVDTPGDGIPLLVVCLGEVLGVLFFREGGVGLADFGNLEGFGCLVGGGAAAFGEDPLEPGVVAFDGSDAICCGGAAEGALLFGGPLGAGLGDED